MDLSGMRRYYEGKRGYSRFAATARVCQDVILSKISRSVDSKSVTIKGGVLMCALTRDSRRATQDIDLDFIRRPLNEDSITDFIARLSSIEDGVTLSVDGPICELRQQDYRGYRVHLLVSDGKSKYNSKLDIGVNTAFVSPQEEAIFDIAAEPGVIRLLANTKEQMFAEKLRSLLIHGARSTRYKDIYDLYYLGHRADLDIEKLKSAINSLIIESDSMREKDFKEIESRLRDTFRNRRFVAGMKSSRSAWSGQDAVRAMDWLPSFIKKIGR